MIVDGVFEVDGGGRGGKVGQVGVVAALDEVEAVLLAAPALGQVEESLYERVLLVRRQAVDEYRPLAEHVEQVEHGEYDVKVGRLEQSGQVLDRVVQVARVRVLDEQRRELQDGEQQRLELRTLRQVARQLPRRQLLLLLLLLLLL